MKLKPIFLNIAVLLFGLIFYCNVSGQTTAPSNISTAVDGLFKERITQDTPGAAVVITKQGKSVFKGCYGLADLEHRIPITSKTMFNLASAAKQFTAFSILLLEKEGRIGLDDDIHKYLPDLPDYSSPVTIRHLLNHTSGIWEYSSTMLYYCGYHKRDDFTLNEIMELLKQQQELLFEPGSLWSYCNTNYVLLAQVVEKITGIPFPEWTRKNIFDPVGMKSSFFIKNSTQLIPDKAEPYQEVEEEFIDGSSNWVNYVGQGYLFSNVDDMALWMDNFRTKKIGGDDVIGKMFQKTKLNNGSESFYGYGLGVLTTSGKMVVQHSGQTGGYKSFMLYCPELELGITVLANERSIDSEGLGNAIFDLYLGKVEATEAISSKTQEFLPFNPESAARFAGGYIVEGLNAKLAVNVGDDYLHGAFFGLGEDFFYPLTEKTFANRSRVNFIEFLEPEDGIPVKVTIRIREDKMIANQIMLDAKDLETRLPEYLGSYYSDAFSTVYSFRVENGRPLMHHRRYGDMPVQPIDVEEFFFILGFLKFNRNENGDVIGFTLTPSDEKFHFQGIDFIKVK